MGDKTYPIETFLNYLSQDATATVVADKVGVDMKTDGEWFKRAYKAAMAIFLEHAEEWRAKKGGLTRDELQTLFGTFINIVNASNKKYQKAKSTPGKKMYALNRQGDAQAMTAFSMNEDDEEWEEEWDKEQREDFINQLYQEGIITKVMMKWQDEYPRAEKSQFDSALKMALDIIMEQQARHSGPLMPSDLKEIQDMLLELVLGFESAKSIFKSTEKAKKKPTKRDYIVDPDPFERGSYSKVGLNEEVDGWSEAKLRQFVKKEFETQIKKGDYMSKKDVKNMIRKTIVLQYKYLWEKSAFFINQI
jgi:hypothetical protein